MDDRATYYDKLLEIVAVLLDLPVEQLRSLSSADERIDRGVRTMFGAMGVMEYEKGYDQMYAEVLQEDIPLCEAMLRLAYQYTPDVDGFTKAWRKYVKDNMIVVQIFNN